MTKHRGRAVTALSLVAVAGLTIAACSSGDSSSESSSASPSTTAAAAMSTAPKTIVDIAAANSDFSTLVSAVKAAGLAETLTGSGPFTVFAPTESAFAKLPAGTLDSLVKPENKQQLSNILTYHVVPAKVMAGDVKPGAVKTVNGAELTIAVNGPNVTLTDGQGNAANVVKADIAGSNGVIHVIDSVLLPPKS
jgi:uncharacterized surface protein with fasciclin (FAS1) repeats